MKIITTIDQLVDACKYRGTDDTYYNILSSIDIHPEEYKKFYTWHPDHYTRNSLAITDEFELLIICFEPGQMSSIHDFNATDAWIHPIMGSLLEERYRINPVTEKIEKVSALTLDSSQYSFVSEHVGIHQFSNLHSGRSASLNLYAKPVEKWNVFTTESAQPKEKKVERHAIYF